MLTTQDILMRDILIALAIALPIFLFAGVFYCARRRGARRMAARAGTALDNLLIKALEWPVFAGAVLLGMYLVFLYLPLQESYDFQIRRGFHVAFIVLAAYGGVALANSIFQWFRLEVTSKTRTSLDDGIVSLLRVLTPLLAGLLALLASLGLFGVKAEGVRHWLLADGTRIGLILLLSVGALLALGVAVPAAIRSFVAQQMPGQPEEEVRKRVNTLTAVLLTAGQVFIIGI